ncbi:hypothetical protein EYF80_059071 [Liparis tanakae]|uniref:Uncharacterized protein n=1 Tax=Liparis tanakae TaxID=230148 RepID=A0A4Z2EPA2_9TELE|nr:hypothetical protein EYF80_059071 [Liparis tanakae]
MAGPERRSCSTRMWTEAVSQSLWTNSSVRPSLSGHVLHTDYGGLSLQAQYQEGPVSCSGKASEGTRSEEQASLSPETMLVKSEESKTNGGPGSRLVQRSGLTSGQCSSSWVHLHEVTSY